MTNKHPETAIREGYGKYHQEVSQPITIRGVWYPSGGAAARALGVTPGAVYTARKKNREHLIGTRKK